MIPCDYNERTSNAEFGDMWSILVFLKAFRLSWHVYSKILTFSTEKDLKFSFKNSLISFSLFPVPPSPPESKNPWKDRRAGLRNLGPETALRVSWSSSHHLMVAGRAVVLRDLRWDPEWTPAVSPALLKLHRGALVRACPLGFVLQESSLGRRQFPGPGLCLLPITQVLGREGHLG